MAWLEQTAPAEVDVLTLGADELTRAERVPGLASRSSFRRWRRALDARLELRHDFLGLLFGNLIRRPNNLTA